MVLRILCNGICRHSKFRRPKLNAILSILRSTSSVQPPEEVFCKKCHRKIDHTLGSQQLDDSSNSRPTLYIAHNTVFNPGQDDDKNTGTLLEDWKNRLAQAGFRQNLAAEETRNNEEVTVATDKRGDQDGQEDSDANKDERLLQRPEPIDDRSEKRTVTDSTDIKPPHIRYRFEVQNEEETFDDLARKYMSMKEDQIDKRLAKEMERLGLPINSEVVSHANVSCSEDAESKVDVPKPEESLLVEAVENKPQYYEQNHWCNVYFKSPNDDELTITNSEEGGNAEHDINKHCTFANDMLPLDSFEKSNEPESPIKKLGVGQNDDIIPCHLLQCMDVFNVDSGVNDDKSDSLVKTMKVDETLPIHLLQGNLVDDVSTAPNAIEELQYYDYITPLEDIKCSKCSPVSDMLHILTVEDIDVNRFDFAAPPVFTRTIPETRNKTISQTEDPHKAYVEKPLTIEERLKEREEVAENPINYKINDLIAKPDPNLIPKTETDLKTIVNAKIMEQIGADTASVRPLRPDQRLDRLVQVNPQVLPRQPQTPVPSQDITDVVHTKILEQVGARRRHRRTTHSTKGLDAIIQMQPMQRPSQKKWAPTGDNIEPLPVRRKVIKDDASKRKAETIVHSFNAAEKAPKTAKELNAERKTETPQVASLNAKQAVKVDERKRTSRETETMVQSCLQAMPTEKAQKATVPNTSTPKTPDDIANQLSLDLNLSLSELLRRVRARNRLQYVSSIKAQSKDICAALKAEYECPTNRPRCPPPPDCTGPCPPPSKPKCPPAPPKCPPDPPKCPPEPPKCPPPKSKPKCPPDPPKCPAEPKCPCPCPPPPKCPPAPPKCPIQSTDPDDPVILPNTTHWDTAAVYVKRIFGLVKSGFSETMVLIPAARKRDLEKPFNLNRIKDFEPWTPIPSWPFPVEEKKKKLQCPSEGCPFTKPGPIRPNCPELPCTGFPKRLGFPDKSIHEKQVKRAFCKTEWTKPKHVDRPGNERRSDLPSGVHDALGRGAGRYGDLWKSWYTIEYELFNGFAKNRNFFTACRFGDPKNHGGTSDTNTNEKCGIPNDEDSKIHVFNLLRTYSELQARTSPAVNKSGFTMIEKTDPPTLDAAKLNQTTKNVDEEQLAQKLETIEEVPLVEANPDIIKQPKKTGPTVMNLSQNDYEEMSNHSDFQIKDDENNDIQTEHSPNLINNYFERQNYEKPNFNDVITLSAVPEIKADEEISLTELMQRVRERNRLLRCRDMDHQLNVTPDQNTSFPQHQSPKLPPGWGWPSTPQHHPYKHHSPMHPHVAYPHPQKAKPITPDSRPEYHRATKVNPVALALYLGPLVTAFRNAAILFPLLTAGLLPKYFGNIKDKNLCEMRSSYEDGLERDVGDRSNVAQD